MTNHTITVVPTKGKTLQKQTLNEWSYGYDFRVLYSTSPLWRKNDMVSKSELDEQTKRYGDKYQVTFEVITTREYVLEKCETDYEFEQELLRKTMDRLGGASKFARAK